MKTRKQTKYPPTKPSALVLKDTMMTTPAESSAMVRTQIYLSREEHHFLQTEARRHDEPMAAVIRRFIDEKMTVPDDAWADNPMLKPFPKDPDWKSPADGAINHDHYLYGTPKKWILVKGKTVPAPPLPDNYHDNPASAKAYDKMLEKMDEFK